MKRKRGEKAEAVCTWCGETFVYAFYSRERKICYDCKGDTRKRAEIERKRRKERKRREEKRLRVSRKKRLSLDEKIREATRLHLTYGKYMALRERRQ